MIVDEAPEPTEAPSRAAEALRLCRAGDEAAGLAVYRSLARPRLIATLPIGLHAHLLEEAGCSAAAAELRRIGVRGGGDVAWRATLPGAAPEAAAAEYAALFARGLANPFMVNRYLLALTALGRTGEVAAIYDASRLLHCVKLSGAEEAAAALLALEGQGEIGSRLSVRNMREIRSIHRTPAFADVMAACRAETAAYLARWAASDHPLARLVPEGFKIGAWGTISRGEGYNTRHTHPVAWATGVYYPVDAPVEAEGGALEIGGWSDPAPPGWPRASIRPEAGLLVLIPSYYVHWTRPLGVPGLRMSIAFDAVPA